MKSSLIKKLSVALALGIFSVLPAIADPYQKGSGVEAFKAADQYGEAYTFAPAAVRYLLVSHDMETGKKANAVLTTLGKEYLPGKKAVYVANIVGMPGVGRMFAIPKMRKYAHRIILGDDAALIAKFPGQEGKVTVLALKEGKVESIAYWTPGTDVLGDLLK